MSSDGASWKQDSSTVSSGYPKRKEWVGRINFDRKLVFPSTTDRRLCETPFPLKMNCKLIS